MGSACDIYTNLKVLVLALLVSTMTTGCYESVNSAPSPDVNSNGANTITSPEDSSDLDSSSENSEILHSTALSQPSASSQLVISPPVEKAPVSESSASSVILSSVSNSVGPDDTIAPPEPIEEVSSTEAPEIGLDFDPVPGTDSLFGEIAHGVEKVAKLRIFNLGTQRVRIERPIIYAGLFKYNGMYVLEANDPGDKDCNMATLIPNPQKSLIGDYCVMKVSINTARVKKSDGSMTFDRSPARAFSTTHKVTPLFAMYWLHENDELSVTKTLPHPIRLAFNPRSEFVVSWDGRSGGNAIFDRQVAGDDVSQLVEVHLKESAASKHIYRVKVTQNSEVKVLDPEAASGLPSCNNINSGVALAPGDSCYVRIQYKSSQIGVSKMKLEVIWTSSKTGAVMGGTHLGGSPYTLIAE